MDNDEIVFYQLWIEMADTYIQYAISALLLPIIFLRTIFGIKDGQSLRGMINNTLFWSWGTMALAIGMGFSHQLLATRKISNILMSEKFPIIVEPRILFKVFVFTFWLSLVFFVVGAVKTYMKNK